MVRLVLLEQKKSLQFKRFVKTTATRTLLDGTLTVTLILTLFETNVNSGPVTKATIQYIRGTYETFARILKPLIYTCCTQTDNHFTSTNFKNKDKLEDRQGAVYTIKCCDCQTTYIGETGRNLSTRLTEHSQTSDEKSKATSTIIFLNTIYRRNIKSSMTLRHALRILQTTINDSL